MKSFRSSHWFWISLLVLALLFGVVSGCRSSSPAPRSDQQIGSDVQAKIQGESALANQNIQVSVVNGVATLSGTATDEASRALAGNDSGSVAGVKTVVNNLIVQPVQQAVSAAPTEASSPSSRQPSPKPRREPRPIHNPVPAEQVSPPPPSPPQEQASAMPAPAPPAPAAPPQPAVQQITLPAGTVLPVRISEALSSKDAQSNDVFHASLASDLGSRGVIVLHQGTPVLGRVVEVHEAAHFKGAALLTLELTQLSADGRKITLVTDTFSKEGTARGKNTAEKAGGGALFGAIVGALAGGGKGAAIGSLAGAAAGTGVNAATRGQQVEIPTESLVNFRLQSPITLTVTTNPAQGDQLGTPPDPQLQSR